ncbi:baseplate J/gp47 family protein [Kistimonas scapharcae]|uniref:Baseplate J/gp47 family protein n=1 Tax=Kistimonas scapharcae TaxID=1036133 RepID=A0ABP8V2D7_9GAMM
MSNNDTTLNLDNLTPEEQAFRDAMEQSGIPTTADGLKAEFQKLADDEGLKFSNNSAFSPFWRLITSVAITPVLWLIAFIIRFVLPQSFAKLATDSFLDWFAWAYDTERKPATALKGEITFHRDSIGTALTINASTWIKTLPINGTVYRVKVTTDTDFPVNAPSARVPVEAEKTGTAYNLAAGYFTILEEPVTGVTEVTNANDWITIPGADEEDDNSLRLRLRNLFTALGDYHVDAVYRAMIAENIGFRPDRIYFRHNAPRGPGSADAFVLFDAGVPSQGYLDQVNDHIRNQGHHGHGDDLLTQALPETQHAISGTFWINPNLDSEQQAALKTAVEQCIRCAFRENTDYTVTQTWPFSRFSFSQLDKELHQLFPDLRSIKWGQDDIVSDLDVPRISSLTLTWSLEALQ